jgi:hypothetical protein
MSLNSGQKYELEIFNKLKSAGFIDNVHSKPESIKGQDVTVINSKGKSGIEVKIEFNKVDFGSGTLGFDFIDKKWFLKEGKTDEYSIIKNIVDSEKFIDTINDKWYENNPNRKYHEPQYLEEEKASNLRSSIVISINRDLRGKVDQENLSTVTKRLTNVDYINKYYISKGSNYIHIKGKGLYWLGGKDPLGIKDKITLFNPSAAEILSRVQYKSRGQWRFGVFLKVTRLNDSKLKSGLDGDLSFLNV